MFFRNDSLPQSQTGTRIGGNDSYQPPGAPQTLQNLGKKPNTYFCSIRLSIQKIRTNPLSSLYILLKCHIKDGGGFSAISQLGIMKSDLEVDVPRSFPRQRGIQAEQWRKLMKSSYVRICVRFPIKPINSFYVYIL